MAQFKFSSPFPFVTVHKDHQAIIVSLLIEYHDKVGCYNGECSWDFVGTRRLRSSSCALVILMERYGNNEPGIIEQDPELFQLNALYPYDVADKDIMEKLAYIQHEIWSSWMRYQFESICQHNEDGSMTIPRASVARWTRQIKTSYIDLTEEEKESDREQVRKFLHLIGRSKL